MTKSRPVRVLVVDDDKEHREALGRILSREGYAVILAADGREALEIVSRDAVELVITDLRMPDLTGMDLLRQVKAIRPETAVLLVTAFGESATYMAAMNLGAAEYLNKPFRREEILAAARKALERRVEA